MGKKLKTKNKEMDIESIHEHILEEDINFACTQYQCIFGANKNLYRYIPSTVDGLKPVQRRALFAMYVNNVIGPNHRKKLNQINGYTVDYHPHGDASVGDVVVGMGQKFNNLLPYVICEGNEGSQKGDEHSAARYLEVWLSDFAMDCFFKEYNWSNVDTKETYTGETVEPETLPAKWPVALVNGYFSSIGYGLSSNIPPYNFKELCETVITLIKDKKAKIKLYPDSPTGCQIIYTKDLDRIIDESKTGGFKLTMRADIDIDYARNIINITSLPMQVTGDSIRVPLAQMCKENKFLCRDGKTPAIKDIHDDTNINDINMHIILSPDANPDEVLEELMKSKLNLQKTYNMSITLIDDYKNYDYSIRSFLLEWIEYRRDMLRSSYNANFVRCMEEEHMNAVKIMVSSEKNAKETIKLCTSSENTEEFARKLMEHYGITSLQAKVISKLSVSGFLKEAHKRYLAEAERLKKEIKEIQEILDDPKKIDARIIADMKYGIEKYGAPRRSKVVKEDDCNTMNDLVCVGLSKDGYIKKVPYGTAIGNISKNSKQLNMFITGTNKETLMIFDNDGNMHFVQISKIPISKTSSSGSSISKFTQIPKGEPAVAVIKCPTNIKLTGEESVVFITAHGKIKRVLLSNLLKENMNLNNKKNVMNIDNNDHLVDALYADNTDCNIVLYTNLGDGIRLDINDIQAQLPNSKGRTGIDIRTMERVEGIKLITPNDKYLIYATNKGKLKRTEIKYFPVMKKKDQPLALINLDDNEKLIGLTSGNDEDQLVCYLKNSDPHVINVSDVVVTTRIAKAKKMIKLPNSDSVMAIRLKSEQ